MRDHPSRRRKSIFAGLLLIAVGALFLIHYLRPGVFDLGEIIRYWPVLLILWGLAMLWDHFAARRANEPPPRTVGGGEFLLVVLALACAAALFAYSQFRRRMGWPYPYIIFEHRYTFTTTLPATPLEPAVQVILSTPRGDITVKPHGSMDLNLVVKKTVPAENRAAALSIADATTVSLEKSPQGIRVESSAPSGGGDEMIGYDASVFPNIALNVTTGRGDLRIDGINGEISAQTSGDVDISRAGSNVTLILESGDLRIHSVAGNLAVTGRGEQVDAGEIGGHFVLNGRFFGPIRIRGASQGVQIRSPRTVLNVNSALARLDADSERFRLSGIGGGISLETRDKDVDIQDAQGPIRIADRDGDVEVHYSQSPRNDIAITDHSGNIDLYLPPNSAFSVTARAQSGDISSDFQTPAVHPVEQSSSSRLEGSFGSGGPKVSLETAYGSIRILLSQPARASK